MPVTIERRGSHSIIRLEGDCNLTSATELKQALLEGLAAGTDLHVDMARIGDFDVTVTQLLWAAGRDAARAGITLSIAVTEAVAAVAREAGFESFPEFSIK